MLLSTHIKLKQKFELSLAISCRVIEVLVFVSWNSSLFTVYLKISKKKWKNDFFCPKIGHFDKENGPFLHKKIKFSFFLKSFKMIFNIIWFYKILVLSCFTISQLYLGVRTSQQKALGFWVLLAKSAKYDDFRRF